MAGNWWDRYETMPSGSAAAAPATPAAAAAPAKGANWWDKYDRLASSAPAAPATPSSAPGSAAGQGTLESAGAGVLRGAKDVIDTGAKALASGFDKIAGTNEGARVAEMNAAGKKEFDDQYRGNTAASVGRVAGQVAATLPVGGFLGQGVRAAGAAGALPAAAVPLGEAIASGGLHAAGAGLGTRVAGGAISGGASAGLVDPDAAATGAVIGGALPGVVGAAARLGGAAEKATRGAAVPSGVRKAAEAGQEAGYVVPPSQVEPSLKNRLLEGVAGKISVAQNASIRNQTVSNSLAKRALGLADDADLSIDALEGLRRNAASAYNPVAAAGVVTPGKAYDTALNQALSGFKSQANSFPGAKVPEVVRDIEALRTPQFDAGDALNMIRSMRESADRAYRAGENLSGKAYRQGAAALEDALETHLESLGQPAADILKNYRDARQLIAKSYSVQNALNPVTGTVNAVKLGSELAKGKPLTGELRQAAEFANAFPKAAQTPERMGSLPQTSPLDWAAATSLGAVTGAGAAAAAGLAARPLARAAALSGPIQRSLAADTQAAPQLGLSARDRLANLDYLPPAAAVGLTSRDR